MCHIRIAAVIFLAACTMASAQQRDPNSLPGRDAHEKFLIAAEPVADAARSKEIFGKKHPYAAGVLAILVYFKNDNDQAVSIDMDRVRLLIAPPGGSRQRIQLMPLDNAISAIANPSQPNPRAPRKPSPFPIPRSGDSKTKEWDKVSEILRPLALEMDVIPPHATVHGYMFFDLAGKWDLLPHAQLYFPDLRLTQSGKALLFFEIGLASK